MVIVLASATLPGAAAMTTSVTADGGHWALASGEIAFVGRDGSTRAVIALTPEGYGAGVGIAVDPYDGSAWVATSARLLLHVANDGQVLGGATLAATADAMSVALDQSVWSLAGDTIHHHARDGRWLESRVIGTARGPGPAAMAVDSLGERLWIVDTDGLLRIALDPEVPPARLSIPLACGIGASALDPRTGRLLVSCGDRVLAFEGSGREDFVLELRALGVDAIEALAYDSATGSIVAAVATGALRIGPTGDVEVLVSSRASELEEPLPFAILPTLALVRPPGGAAIDQAVTEIVFATGASCSGQPCDAPAGYTDGMSLNVDVNGTRLADPKIDSATGRAVARTGGALR
ncbi:MAG: hypothetical protein ACM3QY_03185, partial [Candidatus Levyibacteriota bacterium]